MNAYSNIELALIVIAGLFVGFVIIGGYQARRDYREAVRKEELSSPNNQPISAKTA